MKKIMHSFILFCIAALISAGPGQSRERRPSLRLDLCRTSSTRFLEPRADQAAFVPILTDKSSEMSAILKSYSASLSESYKANFAGKGILTCSVNTGNLGELGRHHSRAACFIALLSVIQDRPGIPILLTETDSKELPEGSLELEFIPKNRVTYIGLTQNFVTLGPPCIREVISMASCFVKHREDKAKVVSISVSDLCSGLRGATASILLLIELLKAVSDSGSCIKVGELRSIKKSDLEHIILVQYGASQA
jgi:hypothetical protein